MTRAGWRLPGYRIEELIGSGASGEVWRARVTATGVDVALKRIWLSGKGQRQAALSEAAFLSALDHPHLMRLHELRHVDDDAIVLVLDLAGGGSLAALLARRGRLTVGEVVTALAPIAAALAYAHGANVVHGDVSAANVLFTDIGLPLLADLGVSRLLGDAAPVRTTPSYIDPHVAGGEVPDETSDVFMLGGIALHALTGAPPWPGTVSAEVLDDAASGRQPDFAGRLAAAGVPDEVAAVVVRALTMNPDLRGTAADFALELRHAATPVAVELTAGRSRRVPTAGVDSWPLESVPAADDDAATSRSVRVPPFAQQQPLTYGVRAPSPFPAGRHSAPRARAGLSRVGVAAAAAVLLVLVAVIGATLWWPSPSPRHSEPVAGRPAAASSSARESVAVQAHSPAAQTESPAASQVDAVPVVLARLDARRAEAFARRDPDLLSGVYSSAALLARDRGLLLSAVPAGCGLSGLHTTFAHVQVLSRTASLVRVRTSVALSASTLVCAGTRAGHAAAAPAATMLIDLARDRAGYRIAAQHTV